MLDFHFFNRLEKLRWLSLSHQYMLCVCVCVRLQPHADLQRLQLLVVDIGGAVTVPSKQTNYESAGPKNVAVTGLKNNMG